MHLTALHVLLPSTAQHTPLRIALPHPICHACVAVTSVSHSHALYRTGVENIAGFKFWVTLTLLEHNQAFASYLVYVLINCSLIVGSVALTVMVAPAAAGSGIAEVKVNLLGCQQGGFGTVCKRMWGSVQSWLCGCRAGVVERQPRYACMPWVGAQVS